MKRLSIVLMALALLLPAQAQTRAPRRAAQRPAAQAGQPAPASTAGQSLPIRRVILYSNGVAFFERRGMVRGDAEVDLPFKQSQVDDVLKSMVVLDLGRGRIGAVSYNSSAPPSSRLADIPFSIGAASSTETSGGLAGGLAAVLGQLQGARVVVTTATRAATGAILTVEARRAQVDANKPPLITHSLVIAAENGEIASFDLAEVRSVRLLDEGARHDVNEFADASASTRRRDAKTIIVTSRGEGQREMAVSYTVAAPIWKTTYRVVLDPVGKPFFQGWAIVDNIGEEDWTGVALSLVSGTPISFIQPIQQPLYRHRPVIPIPQDLNLNPQVYEPGVGTGAGVGSGSGANETVEVTAGAQLVESTQSQLSKNLPLNGRAMDGADMSLAHPPAPRNMSEAITSGESGVETAASGAEVGDLFEYRIEQPVTVRRDRSALIPILQAQMEGERVSVYNESVRADRPMSGLRLKNTSPLTLEGGSLTVLDGDAYAGEALMERLKPGEDRFISFALDLGTLVTARPKGDRERVHMIRIINGVFQAYYYQTERKTYTITNQTEKPRVVFVEHPVRNRWDLSSDTAKPYETTARSYRFRVELGPRESKEVPVVERRELVDNYALSSLSPRDVQVFISRNYVDDATRAAFEKILEIKGRIASAEARMGELDREAKEISADQDRLRENIKALGQTGEARQLIARYIAKAGEQETRLEQISAERKAAEAERGRLQSELEASIRALENLNRKL
ncbi:MAG TPA: hypothetical protein VE262_04820 [Blastocatellia bacterium]|nr:hypothetical protein [Blastocatellia bacterium]